MQNRHDHNPSRLRLSAARMIIGVGCLLAVFL